MKKKILCLCIALTMLISLSGCGKKSDETVAEPTTAPINVTQETASTRDLSSGVVYTGEIKAASDVSVSPKVSGKVTGVNVEIGKYVNAGDVLFTIDDTDLQLSYNQALAGYNSANASYASITGGSAKQTENQVSQAVVTAQINYDSAVTALEREKQLYENNSSVVLAENTYNDAVASYNRALELYNNDVNIIAANNALTTAEDNYNRMQSLFEMGAISQVELDGARTSYENAKANAASAVSANQTQIEAAKTQMLAAEESLKSTKVNSRAALDNAENAVKSAKEALENAIKTRDLTINVINPQTATNAKASVASAKASLDIAKNALNNARVTAPISGYVTSVSVEKGQNAAAGSPAIGIVNMNTVEAEINVTETVVTSLSQGMSANVSIPSANISDLTGTIIAVSPSKNVTTGLFTVKVSIPNNDGTLKGGMFADVVLNTLNKSSLAVPADAIIVDGEESYVYINNNGSAEKKVVTTGETDGTYTEITSGISEGDKVVVSGKEFITEDNNNIAVTDAE